MKNLQYNLSNPACYQTEKKIRIRQGAGIERLTYPRDIKVTLVSIGIQHTADNGYVNELYIVHTNLFQVKTFEVIISYPQIKPLKIKFLCLYYTNVSPSCFIIVSFVGVWFGEIFDNFAFFILKEYAVDIH